MSQRDSEYWTKARRARDKLIDRFMHHPDVSGIDIGYPPERDEETEEIVLRVQVREHWMEAKADERNAFPEQVDGIRVVVMSREYRLDTTAPELDEDQAIWRVQDEHRDE